MCSERIKLKNPVLTQFYRGLITLFISLIVMYPTNRIYAFPGKYLGPDTTATPYRFVSLSGYMEQARANEFTDSSLGIGEYIIELEGQTLRSIFAPQQLQNGKIKLITFDESGNFSLITSELEKLISIDFIPKQSQASSGMSVATVPALFTPYALFIPNFDMFLYNLMISDLYSFPMMISSYALSLEGYEEIRYPNDLFFKYKGNWSSEFGISQSFMSDKMFSGTRFEKDTQHYPTTLLSTHFKNRWNGADIFIEFGLVQADSLMTTRDSWYSYGHRQTLPIDGYSLLSYGFSYHMAHRENLSLEVAMGIYAMQARLRGLDSDQIEDRSVYRSGQFFRLQLDYFMSSHLNLSSMLTFYTSPDGFGPETKPTPGIQLSYSRLPRYTKTISPDANFAWGINMKTHSPEDTDGLELLPGTFFMFNISKSNLLSIEFYSSGSRNINSVPNLNEPERELISRAVSSFGVIYHYRPYDQFGRIKYEIGIGLRFRDTYSRMKETYDDWNTGEDVESFYVRHSDDAQIPIQFGAAITLNSTLQLIGGLEVELWQIIDGEPTVSPHLGLEVNLPKLWKD